MNALYTFVYILFMIIAIFVGLIIHELGHFTFAKIFKVNVKEFSIGIGPKIFSKKVKNTKISWRILPIMAYVLIDSEKLVNLYTELKDEQQKEIQEFYLKNKNEIDLTNGNKWIQFKYKRLLKQFENYEFMIVPSSYGAMIDNIAIWKQIIIYLGGIFFNIIFFTIFFLIQYFGLESIYKTLEIRDGITVIRDPFVQLGNTIVNLFKNMVFYNAWAPEGSIPSVGTPVGDAIQVSKLNLSSELLTYLIINYFSIFNLVLFAFNVLPIPPLDGFKVLTTSLSKNRKIKVSKKTENILTYIGIGLIVYIFLTGIIADVIPR